MRKETKQDRVDYVNQALENLKSKGYFVGFNKQADVWIAFKIEESGKCVVQSYNPAKTKRNFGHMFPSQEEAEYFVEKFVQRRLERKASAKSRHESRVSKKATDFWQVGDVLYYSWGYDQTNIDWFQVTRVSAASVWIRPIAENTNDHGQPGGGKTHPRRNEFTGEEVRKEGRSEYVGFDHGCGTKWTGGSKYCSSDR
jgi:hypothetical protein